MIILYKLFSLSRTAHLQNALFKNVLGLEPSTLGKDILESGKKHLSELYPHVHQIETEKVTAVLDNENSLYKIITNKNIYLSSKVVIALNYSKPFLIEGLMQYLNNGFCRCDALWLIMIPMFLSVTNGLLFAEPKTNAHCIPATPPPIIKTSKTI